MKNTLDPQLTKIIQQALDEDIGPGDMTSNSIIPSDARMTGQIVAKQSGVIAGLDIAAAVYQLFDTQVRFQALVEEGEHVDHTTTPDKRLPVALVTGSARSLLTVERTALNFMGRISGIATLTHQFVEAVAGTTATILDTRKTAPGLRMLDKLAVARGGGANHRIGLYDMILIKDNHIDFAGGIRKAVERARTYLDRKTLDLKIEIESRNCSEIEEICAVGGIDRIMLDNFSLDETRSAVKMINGRFETESSGGITLKNIRAYAECGVDYISVGDLTHHINSLDLSLKAAK